MVTFLALLPAVFFMLLAQMGRRRTWPRSLVYAFFGLVNLFLLVDGILLLMRGGSFQITVNEATLSSQDISPQFLGQVFLFTGGVALILMIPLVQRLLALFMHIRPGDSVHTLALVYACYLVGLTVIQTPLLETLFSTQEPMALPASELLGQASAFVLLALVGAGLGTQRSITETARRLKLAWPGGRELRVAVLATIALVIMQAALGALWAAFSPERVKEIDELTRSLLGEFFNPWGAVVLGISTGISEELVFRGALQPRFGLLATTALFSLVHSQYLFSFALVIVFLLGLVLGLVRDRVNTTAAILTHALYNTVLVLLATYGVQ